MVRFIYACAAIIILSFIAVPVFNGVSKEHDRLSDIAQNTAEIETNEDLSFRDIYALANDSSEPNAQDLNDITPAAGDDKTEDSFSQGFKASNDTALEDTPVEPVIENTDESVTH